MCYTARERKKIPDNTLRLFEFVYFLDNLRLLKIYFKFISLTIVIVSTIISCSKQIEIPSLVPMLIGSWTLVSTSTTGCTDPLDNEPLAPCTICPTLVFTETTMTISYPGSTQTKVDKYSVDGNLISAAAAGSIASSGVSGGTPFTVSSTTLSFTISPTADNGHCQTVFTYQKN